MRQRILIVLLLVFSIVIYTVHQLIFHDFYHISYYTLLDIGFIPINVIIVSLIIERLLKDRDKRILKHKLNMVIGTFYGDTGTELLRMFRSYDPDISHISSSFLVKTQWAPADFENAKKRIQSHSYKVKTTLKELEDLKRIFLKKRQFLLHLLENQNLLEHDDFTELLWAVFHLSDELCHRKNILQTPAADHQHLDADIQRAYSHLAKGWLAYMDHLRMHYPYLYALGIRTNPFDEHAQWTVQI